jgi:hypothetical protein
MACFPIRGALGFRWIAISHHLVFPGLILCLKILPVASGLEWRCRRDTPRKIRRTKIGYAGEGKVIGDVVESGGAAQALPQAATHAESSGGSKEGKGGRYGTRGWHLQSRCSETLRI